MFCTGCGAENTLSASKQKYCRWCGMLILTNTEFSLDERVAQELARLREEDRQLTKLRISLNKVRHSLALSFIFLVILSVQLALNGDLHIGLFLSIFSFLMCGAQFWRFERLFHGIINRRNTSVELTISRAQIAGDLLSAISASDYSTSKLTAPMSITKPVTLDLTADVDLDVIIRR